MVITCRGPQTLQQRVCAVLVLQVLAPPSSCADTPLSLPEGVGPKWLEGTLPLLVGGSHIAVVDARRQVNSNPPRMKD